MANNEVDKIDSLKKDREKSYDEVAQKREEEEKKLPGIGTHFDENRMYARSPVKASSALGTD